MANSAYAGELPIRDCCCGGGSRVQSGVGSSSSSNTHGSITTSGAISITSRATTLGSSGSTVESASDPNEAGATCPADLGRDGNGGFDDTAGPEETGATHRMDLAGDGHDDAAAFRPWVATMSLVVLLLASCGGSEASVSSTALSANATTTSSANTTTTSAAPPTAVLRVHSASVEVQEPGGVFGPALDGQALGEGAAVRTSPTGRASVEWFDGSVTRLDYDTEFRLTQLQSVESGGGTVIEAGQAYGGSYHRVEELTGTGSRFSVVTPTASAGVEGTTYAVVGMPDGSTSVIVIIGAVVVTAVGGEVVVEAGLIVDIGADGSIEGPIPIPDEVLNSDWIVFNRGCDGGACPSVESPGSLESLAIAPARAVINVGESQEYTAERFDGAGNSMGLVPATYEIEGVPCDGSSCAPAEPGDYTVTGAFEGLTGTAHLTVLATGDIQVTLDWKALADLDLSVTDPFGETIEFHHRTSESGGRLDREAYPGCDPSRLPPENVVWDTAPPAGEYSILVNAYDLCGEVEVAFELTVRIRGEVVLFVDDLVLTPGSTYYIVGFSNGSSGGNDDDDGGASATG